MNTLLIEILQWMQNNNYRRASFDRLCGIIPSAATYDQLIQLVNENPTTLRMANLKGGLPGLAVQDNVHISSMLALLTTLPAPSTPLTIGYGNTPPAPAPAPSVTPTEIEAEIHTEYYLNVGTVLGVEGPLSRLTLCVITLKNEFTVVGKSACVYPERFNAEIGTQLAREDAVKQIWPYLGFRLADKRTVNYGVTNYPNF